MDAGTIRGLGTVVVFLAFVGLAIWAFSGRRKQEFDEANLLPFADDPEALAKLSALKKQEKGPEQ